MSTQKNNVLEEAISTDSFEEQEDVSSNSHCDISQISCDEYGNYSDSGHGSYDEEYDPNYDYDTPVMKTFEDSSLTTSSKFIDEIVQDSEPKRVIISNNNHIRREKPYQKNTKIVDMAPKVRKNNQYSDDNNFVSGRRYEDNMPKYNAGQRQYNVQTSIKRNNTQNYIPHQQNFGYHQYYPPTYPQTYNNRQNSRNNKHNGQIMPQKPPSPDKNKQNRPQITNSEKKRVVNDGKVVEKYVHPKPNPSVKNDNLDDNLVKISQNKPLVINSEPKRADDGKFIEKIVSSRPTFSAKNDYFDNELAKIPQNTTSKQQLANESEYRIQKELENIFADKKLDKSKIANNEENYDVITQSDVELGEKFIKMINTDDIKTKQKLEQEILKKVDDKNNQIIDLTEPLAKITEEDRAHKPLNKDNKIKINDIRFAYGPQYMIDCGETIICQDAWGSTMEHQNMSFWNCVSLAINIWAKNYPDETNLAKKIPVDPIGLKYLTIIKNTALFETDEEKKHIENINNIPITEKIIEYTALESGKINVTHRKFTTITSKYYTLNGPEIWLLKAYNKYYLLYNDINQIPAGVFRKIYDCAELNQKPTDISQ